MSIHAVRFCNRTILQGPLSPQKTKPVSSAFDKSAGILYVNIRQTFSVWFLPFYNAPVRLISVLTLRTVDKSCLPREGDGAPQSPVYIDIDPDEGKLYFIARQQDYYQVNDSLRLIGLRFGAVCWAGLQLFTTGIIIGLGLVYLPFYYWLWPSWRVRPRRMLKK